jgi:predicted RNA binding protein YcfA (HicA-like mRNA interferase family)
MASEVRFPEVRQVLERHGWTLDRISGSHHMFRGKDRPLVSIPVHHGKVQPKYVRKVEKAVAEVIRRLRGDAR